jgi:1,4-dihydroxy-6-naphthoate synthase
MRITLGYSPCPNDTFIFGALANGLIDTQGIDFEIVMDDVEALNKMAFAGVLDVTKLSYHAFAHLTTTYRLLQAGSALGNNCGPLLVAKTPLDTAQIEHARIAIPGKMTTANFLLSLAYPNAIHKVETLFSDIENAVCDGHCDAGLIIHENRFTYQQKGLVKLIDLGEYWESTTGLPIPLGGIVIKKEYPEEVQQLVNQLIKESVTFAYAHTDQVMPYIRTHAQAMEDHVMQSHIDLYVNEYSIDLGGKGRHAVQTMFNMAHAKGLIGDYDRNFMIQPLSSL